MNISTCHMSDILDLSMDRIYAKRIGRGTRQDTLPIKHIMEDYYTMDTSYIEEETTTIDTQDNNSEQELSEVSNNDTIKDENDELVDIDYDPHVYKEKIELTFKNYLEDIGKEDIDDEDIDNFAYIQINKLMDKTEGPLECLKIFHITDKGDMHDVVNNNYIIDGRRSMIDYDAKIFRLELIITIPAPIEEPVEPEDDNDDTNADTATEGDNTEEATGVIDESQGDILSAIDNDSIMVDYSSTPLVDDEISK